MTFSKHVTKKNLDSIREMTDREIAINADFIRKTAESALCLIQQWDGIIIKYKKQSRRMGVFNKAKDGEQE